MLSVVVVARRLILEISGQPCRRRHLFSVHDVVSVLVGGDGAAVANMVGLVWVRVVGMRSSWLVWCRRWFVCSVVVLDRLRCATCTQNEEDPLFITLPFAGAAAVLCCVNATKWSHRSNFTASSIFTGAHKHRNIMVATHHPAKPARPITKNFDGLAPIRSRALRMHESF